MGFHCTYSVRGDLRHLPTWRMCMFLALCQFKHRLSYFTAILLVILTRLLFSKAFCSLVVECESWQRRVVSCRVRRPRISVGHGAICDFIDVRKNCDGDNEEELALYRCTVMKQLMRAWALGSKRWSEKEEEKDYLLAQHPTSMHSVYQRLCIRGR